MSGASMAVADASWLPVMRGRGARIAIAAGLLLILYGIGAGMVSLFSGHAPQKKPVVNIRILPDAPPPPPPPPPREQPKEQPKEMKVEPPKPQEAQPAPAEALKMEGAAGDGASPFAAGAVTNEYQGGETRIGGRDSAYRFAFYTDQIKALIEDALAKDKQLANGQYRVVIRIWLKPDGSTEKVELGGSSGDPATDELIKAALTTMPSLSARPPEDMPQPVKLRITAKRTG
ncbi:MAG: TonB-dependent receptor [Gallionellaceae bacterium]|nr:MAG: TonB-dependent receptor [Gallionellaceae bacterium]